MFADVRTIIGDDAALETGILPALEQYNTEQLVVVELNGKSVRAPPTRPGRDARSR